MSFLAERSGPAVLPLGGREVLYDILRPVLTCLNPIYLFCTHAVLGICMVFLKALDFAMSFTVGGNSFGC